MEKALFMKHQEPVTVDHINGETWFTICLNERIEERTYDSSFEQETSKTYTDYVYDFNQFKDNSLDEEDVKAHPENYLDYVPKQEIPVTPANIEERVATLEMKQEVSDQALQDVMLMVMGGE